MVPVPPSPVLGWTSPPPLAKGCLAAGVSPGVAGERGRCRRTRSARPAARRRDSSRIGFDMSRSSGFPLVVGRSPGCHFSSACSRSPCRPGSRPTIRLYCSKGSDASALRVIASRQGWRQPGGARGDAERTGGGREVLSAAPRQSTCGQHAPGEALFALPGCDPTPATTASLVCQVLARALLPGTSAPACAGPVRRHAGDDRSR